MVPIYSIVDVMIDFSHVYLSFVFLWIAAAYYYQHKYRVLKRKYDNVINPPIKPKPILPKTKLDLEREQYLKLRSQILLRDNFRCQEKGCSYYKHLEVHHIIPRSKGGSDDPENLITLCQRCHDKKHGRHRKQENHRFKHSRRNRRKKRNRWINKNKQKFRQEPFFPEEQPRPKPKEASPNRRHQLYEKWQRNELNQTR